MPRVRVGGGEEDVLQQQFSSICTSAALISMVRAHQRPSAALISMVRAHQRPSSRRRGKSRRRSRRRGRTRRRARWRRGRRAPAPRQRACLVPNTPPPPLAQPPPPPGRAREKGTGTPVGPLASSPSPCVGACCGEEAETEETAERQGRTEMAWKGSSRGRAPTAGWWVGAGIRSEEEEAAMVDSMGCGAAGLCQLDLGDRGRGQRAEGGKRW